MTQTSERRRFYSDYPAPSTSLRGRDLYSGYLQLSAAIVNQAVLDCMASRDPGLMLESLFWLCCSPACDLMLQNMMIEKPGVSLLLEKTLLDEGLKRKLKFKKYKYSSSERNKKKELKE